MKKRKGVALLWMILSFSVLMILTSSILTVFRQDLSETRRQNERVQAYYIALSGIDLVYAALYEPGKKDDRIKAVSSKISSGSAIAETILIYDDSGKQRGQAEITIDKVEEEVVGAEPIKWIRVTSVGRVTGRDVTESSVMRINMDNINQIIRERR